MAAVAAAAALAPVTLSRSAVAQAPAPTTPAPKVVRIPFPRDDGTLTPYTFQLGYPLLTLVYDTLLWRDTEGIARPWLARTLEVNDQATSFTITLNPGVVWHDGRPLTAEDVRFTLAHVAANPSPRFTAEVAEVANVATPNATTVVITTKRASPGFIDQTLADLPIMPAHLWRGVPAGQTPPGLAVGSGPYRLVERLEGGGYKFDANPAYFKGPPSVPQIVVPIISDLGGTLAGFRSNQVDMVPLRLPPAEVRATEGLTSKVARGPSYWGVQLVFNLRQAPFNDLGLRQAVTKAIDLERLVDTVGDSVPADKGIIHPDSTWAPEARLKVTDEEGAKPALAGLTQAVEVLSADNDPVHIETARQVALALERGGVTASSATRSTADLTKALGGDGAEPTFSLAITTLGPASSYDPDYLARLFGSGTATTSGYSSAEFDKRALVVATTVDAKARKAAAVQELQLLATDLPTLPLLFPNGAFVFRPASHDAWRYVRGVGVLDKQSFVPVAASEQAPASTTSTIRPAPPVASGIDAAPDGGSGGGFPFAVVPIGLVGAALVLVALAIVRRGS